MQAARSTSFASFDTHERSSKGINGALTPARQHRNHRPKNTNDFYPAASASTSTPHPAYPGDQTPSRLRPRQERPVGGEGISLQETEARIDELERSEFDLKLKLFYMEEQLESASGGDDVVQLHKEVIEAKRHRTQAEQKARAAGEALSGLEAKCRELQTQVRDSESQRTKDRENWAMLEGENEARLKKHTHLLEDALRAERAENARLRLANGTDRQRASWDGGGGGRRRSTGEDGRGQPDPWRGSGGSGAGFGREQRDQQQQQLAAKIRSQDSSLRSLRADVTTLRRRLRTQGETLAQQKEDNAAVRRAAEQVACVEAEEIARLAVDLERAARAAKAEADKRRHAEKNLAAAEARLSEWGTGAPEARCSRPRSQVRSPRGTGTGTGGGWGGRDGGREKTHGFHPEEASEASPEDRGERESSSLPPSPPSRGALGSTIASRGRSVRDGNAAGWNRCTGSGGGDSSRGKGRASVSPRRGGRNNAETKGHSRRPWGSSPPPSPRRKGDGPTGGASTVAGSRRRALVGGGAASADRKQQHRRRHSEERTPGERAPAGAGGRGGDPGWRGGTPSKPQASQTGKEPPGREGRHTGTSVGRREAGSLPTSTERRGGGRDPPAEAETSAAPPRGGPPISRGPQGATAGAGASAALRGVDLTAKIAQELRAAVATTPASAASPGYFGDGSGGQNTPAGGGGRVGGAERGESLVGCLEGGSLLKSVWQGTGQFVLDGDRPNKPIASLRSREVAELESDVQHIFQFFAAKDGRRRSSGMGAAARGEGGEAEAELTLE